MICLCFNLNFPMTCHMEHLLVYIFDTIYFLRGEISSEVSNFLNWVFLCFCFAAVEYQDVFIFIFCLMCLSVSSACI